MVKYCPHSVLTMSIVFVPVGTRIGENQIHHNILTRLADHAIHCQNIDFHPLRNIKSGRCPLFLLSKVAAVYNFFSSKVAAVDNFFKSGRRRQFFLVKSGRRRPFFLSKLAAICLHIGTVWTSGFG